MVSEKSAYVADIEPQFAEAAAPSGTVVTKRLIAASMIGTALEWYDFMIYNTMAALVFNTVFFSNVDPLVGMLLAFSTYAVGYISRPLGGVVFGALGDRLGRRAVLVMTLVVMGVTTASVAILPGYNTLGLLSPALLVSLRFLQGVALGGEWAGAVLLTVEHGRPDQRGLNASWAQIGPAAGTLLSSAVIGLVTVILSDQDFAAWGWRLPFGVSALLVLFGLWVRTRIQESPVFEEMRAHHEIAHAPVIEFLTQHRRSLIIAAAARIGPDVVYALMVVFSLTYITQILGLSRSLALAAILVGAAFNMIAVPFFGALTDRIGRRPVYAIGLLAAVPLGLLFFELLGTKSPVICIAAVALGMIIHAAMYSAQGAFITEQFTPRVRYTGSSIAYTFGSLAGGGAFAPLIMTSIFKETGGTWGISLYVLLALSATGLAMFFARETRAD